MRCAVGEVQFGNGLTEMGLYLVRVKLLHELLCGCAWIGLVVFVVWGCAWGREDDALKAVEYAHALFDEFGIG